jgi:hypothetical protein
MEAWLAADVTQKQQAVARPMVVIKQADQGALLAPLDSN